MHFAAAPAVINAKPQHTQQSRTAIVTPSTPRQKKCPDLGPGITFAYQTLVSTWLLTARLTGVAASSRLGLFRLLSFSLGFSCLCGRATPLGALGEHVGNALDSTTLIELLDGS